MSLTKKTRRSNYQVGDLLLKSEDYLPFPFKHQAAYAMIVVRLWKQKGYDGITNDYMDVLAFWNNANPRILNRMFIPYINETYHRA